MWHLTGGGGSIDRGCLWFAILVISQLIFEVHSIFLFFKFVLNNTVTNHLVCPPGSDDKCNKPMMFFFTGKTFCPLIVLTFTMMDRNDSEMILLKESLTLYSSTRRLLVS